MIGRLFCSRLGCSLLTLNFTLVFSPISRDLMARAILPMVGACVVLTIDPIASLDPETLEDPEAVAACKKLVNKQYVGFVRERVGFYRPWDPYNSCAVEFLLQGKPQGYPSRFIEPRMSIPILPAADEPHPSSRSPLEPSTPLPWRGCYVSPFWAVQVRSPTLFTEDPVDCILDRAELLKHLTWLRDDFADQQASLNAAEEAKDGRVGSPDLITSVEELQGVKLPIPPGSSLDIVSDSQGNPPASGTPIPAATDSVGNGIASMDEIFDFLSSSPSTQPTITANFSHDLSTVKELNDPADYCREVAAIARIQEEAKPRLAKARALAIKEAAKLNAEYDERTLDMLVARLPPRGPFGRVSGLASKVKKRAAKLVRPVLRLLRPARVLA
ncbi:hypothetical protein B0H15DRAFT_51292 [Mycena belliarum]|uniref:Uncharacterized protein n=1 Tax=Mycena belliarum TaxID=1033014 RepID=A0AAD6XSL0_9AGAR|nr:hypothetical protein B0H15DRAFT_51292 [Mycena belliae]